MRPGVKSGIIIGIALVILGLSVACTSSRAATGSPSPTASQPPSSGTFKVTELAVNPAEVNAGVEILITAKVANTGSAASRYRGSVRIENLTKPSLPSFLGSQEVSIPSGSTQLVGVVTSIKYPGKYKLTWDEMSREVEVTPAEAPSSSGGALTGPALDFTATDVVTGKTVSLKDYKGSPVLLNFVNYGCDPSLNEKVSAQLMAIKQMRQQRGDFVPISVFCGCCPPEVLRQFAKENNFDWPWILDADYSIAAKYGNVL